MSTVFALGLFKLAPLAPSPEQFARMHELQLDVLTELGAVPTYYHFGGVGAAGSAKMKKFGTLAHHRARMSKGFDGIGSVSLAANPAASEEPAYDRFVSISYSYLDHEAPDDEHYKNRIELFFEIDRSVLDVRPEALMGLVGRLANAQSWDYGFAFSAPRENEPLLYVMSASNGRLSDEDERRLTAWYNAPATERVSKLRDVFEHNFVNPTQLSFTLPDGRTLRAFIEEDESSALSSIAPNLELWTVAPGATERVRKRLLGSGILITE